jgi:hypothetical protein
LSSSCDSHGDQEQCFVSRKQEPIQQPVVTILSDTSNDSISDYTLTSSKSRLKRKAISTPKRERKKKKEKKIESEKITWLKPARRLDMPKSSNNTNKSGQKSKLNSNIRVISPPEQLFFSIEPVSKTPKTNSLQKGSTSIKQLKIDDMFQMKSISNTNNIINTSAMNPLKEILEVSKSNQKDNLNEIIESNTEIMRMKALGWTKKIKKKLSWDYERDTPLYLTTSKTEKTNEPNSGDPKYSMIGTGKDSFNILDLNSNISSFTLEVSTDNEENKDIKDKELNNKDMDLLERPVISAAYTKMNSNNMLNMRSKDTFGFGKKFAGVTIEQRSGDYLLENLDSRIDYDSLSAVDTHIDLKKESISPEKLKQVNNEGQKEIDYGTTKSFINNDSKEKVDSIPSEKLVQKKLSDIFK